MLNLPRWQVIGIIAVTLLAALFALPNLLPGSVLDKLPAWYQQKLEGLMHRVEEALGSHFQPGQDAERQRAARVLWAGVHGITSLSTADKLSVVTNETASRLIEDLVGTYLAGLSRLAGSSVKA